MTCRFLAGKSANRLNALGNYFFLPRSLSDAAVHPHDYGYNVKSRSLRSNIKIIQHFFLMRINEIKGTYEHNYLDNIISEAGKTHERDIENIAECLNIVDSNVYRLNGRRPTY